jgi:hypothetical protein
LKEFVAKNEIGCLEWVPYFTMMLFIEGGGELYVLFVVVVTFGI